MDDPYRTRTTRLSQPTSTTTEPTIDLLGLLEPEATVVVKVKKRQ